MTKFKKGFDSRNFFCEIAHLHLSPHAHEQIFYETFYLLVWTRKFSFPNFLADKLACTFLFVKENLSNLKFAREEGS